MQSRANFRRFGSADIGGDMMRILQAFNQEFDFAAAGFFAEEAGGQNARIVKYQQVLRLDKLRQIADFLVVKHQILLVLYLRD